MSCGERSSLAAVRRNVATPWYRRGLVGQLLTALKVVSMTMVIGGGILVTVNEPAVDKAVRAGEVDVTAVQFVGVGTWVMVSGAVLAALVLVWGLLVGSPPPDSAIRD